MGTNLIITLLKEQVFLKNLFEVARSPKAEILGEKEKQLIGFCDFIIILSSCYI